MSSDQWGSNPWGQPPQQPDGSWGQQGQGQSQGQGQTQGQGLGQQNPQGWLRQSEQQGPRGVSGQQPREDPQAPAYTPPPEYALQPPMQISFLEQGDGPSYGRGQGQQAPVAGAGTGVMPGQGYGQGVSGSGAGVVYGQVGPQVPQGPQGAPQQGGAQGYGQVQGHGQGRSQGQGPQQFGGQGYSGGPQAQPQIPAQPHAQGGQVSAQPYTQPQPAEGAHQERAQEPAQEPVQERRGNGAAAAGLLTCFVPLVGLVLSIVGLGKARARVKAARGSAPGTVPAPGTGRRLATAGILLSLLFSLVWAEAGYYYFEIRSPNAGDAGCVSADADYVRYSALLEQDAAAMTKGAVGSVAFTFAVKKYQSDLSGLIAAYGADTAKAAHSEVRTAIQTVSSDLAQLDIELGNLASAHYAGAVHVMDLNSKLMTDFQHLESLCDSAPVG